MTRFRILILTLIAICSCFYANAQTTIKAPDNSQNAFYVLCCIESWTVMSDNKGGVLGISFPYSVTGSGGTAGNSVFSKRIHPFSSGGSVYLSPFSMEIGTDKYFFSGQLSFVPNKENSNVNVSLGYGRNFYFDPFNKNPGDQRKSPFIFKPSINIGFTQLGNGGNTVNTDNTFLGSIDNMGKTIRLLGQVADSSFDISETDDNTGATTTSTYGVQTLYVNYVHRELAIIPKIAISNNQNIHKVYWELNVGCQLSISQTDGIGLIQLSPDQNKRLGGFIDLYKNNVTTTYNNTTITKSPFNLSGIYFGFKIGIVFAKKRANI